MEVAELPAGEPQTKRKLRTEGDKRPLVAVVAAAMAASVVEPNSLANQAASTPIGQLVWCGAQLPLVMKDWGLMAAELHDWELQVQQTCALQIEPPLHAAEALGQAAVAAPPALAKHPAWRQQFQDQASHQLDSSPLDWIPLLRHHIDLLARLSAAS